MRVGIVICNYNKAEMVCSCIESVLESVYKDYELFVCDNASTDNSAELIDKRFSGKVKLVINEVNKGGSGGFNAGLRKALETDCEYLWLLDNDVLVDENALSELVNFLDENPDVGMAGSKIDNMENPDYVQNFGMTVDFERFGTVAKFRGCPEDGTLPAVTYSDAVPACSVLVRRSVTDIIGLLPEDNFLYWDDTEWGMLSNLAGFKVASVGKSLVLHSMGAKREEITTFPTYYAFRNGIDFFMRFTPEEKIPDMCISYLRDIFDIQYEGIYNNEKNKAYTVMKAFDDALHGVRGKADDDVILPVTSEYERHHFLMSNFSDIGIVPAGNNYEAEFLKEFLYDMGFQGNITISEDRYSFPKGAAVIVMCPFLFEYGNFEKGIFVADGRMNLYLGGDDEQCCMNYVNSRDTFISAYLPLFIEKTKEIRKKRKVL